MVRSYNKTIENKIKARNRMNKNEILKTINKLSNNAMFNVSLTSRELFHTNFWTWMLRKYPKVFTPVFYPEYNKKDKIEVLREYKNTDLFLKIGDKSIIIENKLKSLPDKTNWKDIINSF